MLASTIPVPIGGVAPMPVEDWFFTYEYLGLRLVCPFTGVLILVTDLVSKVYRGVTPQPPAYRDVRELRFENWRVVETLDHSALMAETRRRLGALRAARPMEEWRDDDWERFFAMMWPFEPGFEEQPPA